MGDTTAWGVEGMSSLLLSGDRASVLDDGNVPEVDSTDGCTIMQVYLMLLNGTLKKCYNGKFYVMYISPQ